MLDFIMLRVAKILSRRKSAILTSSEASSTNCEVLENGKTDCSKIPEATKCLGFRQTKGCDPNGDRDDSHDSGCDIPITYGRSGYCECGGGRRVMEVSCEHSHFTCESACAGKNSGNETVGKTFFDDFLRECGDGDGLAVYPKKGDALLFYSQTPDAHLDPQSFHGGCPIIKGDKWGANVWVWNRKLYLFFASTYVDC